MAVKHNLKLNLTLILGCIALMVLLVLFLVIRNQASSMEYVTYDNSNIPISSKSQFLTSFDRDSFISTGKVVKLDLVENISTPENNFAQVNTSGFVKTGDTIILPGHNELIDCTIINGKKDVVGKRQDWDTYSVMCWDNITAVSQQLKFKQYCESTGIASYKDELAIVTYKGVEYYVVATTFAGAYWRGDTNKPGIAVHGQTMRVYIRDAETGAELEPLNVVVGDVKSMNDTDGSGGDTPAEHKYQVDTQIGHGYYYGDKQEVTMSIIEFFRQRGASFENAQVKIPYLRSSYIYKIELGEVIDFG